VQNCVLIVRQVIVNRCADGVGNTWGSLGKVVVRGRLEAEGRVGVEVGGGTIVVGGKEGGEGLVLVVNYKTELVEVEIRAGKNRGKTLPHRNVVCDIKRVGMWRDGVQAFEMPGMMEVGLVLRFWSGPEREGLFSESRESSRT